LMADPDTQKILNGSKYRPKWIGWVVG
jgi:hypothetical protein